MTDLSLKQSAMPLVNIQQWRLPWSLCFLRVSGPHLGEYSDGLSSYYIYSVLYDMMTSSNGNIFRITGSLCREFTGHWWTPLTKASDEKLWCFLWSVPEQMVEQTVKMPVIWDAIELIMMSLMKHAHSLVVVVLSSWPNQISILHMARQLSCHDMCKIVIRSDHYFSSNGNENFYKIWNS